jgi:hypothetical protein
MQAWIAQENGVVSKSLVDVLSSMPALEN